MKISSFFTLQILIALLLPVHASTITLNSTAESGNSAFSAELLTSSCAKVGVVMFHGRGSTPTGPVVAEISGSLNRAGYSTLSIDNPLPLNQQTDFTSYINDVNSDNYVFPEAYARMRTAINHLQSLGVEQVVVAGFSLGSRLATAHVARGQTDELPVIGLIGVGMYGTSIDPLNVSTTLDEISVPVLDLYGDTDTNAVNTALARQDAYNTGTGTSYTQSSLVCISGLNCHQLEGLKGDDSKLFEIELNAWMQSFAPASVVLGCTPVPTSNSTPQASNSSGSLELLFMGMLFVILALRIRYNKE